MSNTHQVLLLIDIQNDYFKDGKWTLSGIDYASDNAVALLEKARATKTPVVHVQHIFLGEAVPFFAEGSEGAEIHNKVAPRSGEKVVVKHHVNAFRDTDLMTLLKDLDCRELIIAGAMSHMCIEAGTRSAADAGLKVIVAEDACATCDLEWNGHTVVAKDVHAASMASLSFGYAEVISTEQVLSQFASPVQP